MTVRTYQEVRRALDDHVNLEAVANAAGRLAPPDLGRMRKLAGALGDPQSAYPVVHVTGTNGKTTTARMIASLLTEMGLRVGTYTSPDLGRINERMALGGEPISDEDFAEAMGAALDVSHLVGERVLWFELVTASAFRWFADVPVDVAVVEVGMLGRFDATNIAHGQVAVVTNVGHDHMAYAGPTRAHVAAEKAGIVKPGSSLVLGETDPELRRIFEAEQSGEMWVRDEDFCCEDSRRLEGGRVVDLRTPRAAYADVFMPLHGAYQGENAAVALAATEAFFGGPLAEDVVAQGFAAVRSPGRTEVVSVDPLVVLDGAHNPEGMHALAATIEDEFDVAGRLIVVFGALKGHDPSELISVFRGFDIATVVACAPSWPRAIPTAEVAAAAREQGFETEEVPSVAEAVRRGLELAASDDLVLVTGSLYVVGEARAGLVRA